MLVNHTDMPVTLVMDNATSLYLPSHPTPTRLPTGYTESEMGYLRQGKDAAIPLWREVRPGYAEDAVEDLPPQLPGVTLIVSPHVYSHVVSARDDVAYVAYWDDVAHLVVPY